MWIQSASGVFQSEASVDSTSAAENASHSADDEVTGEDANDFAGLFNKVLGSFLPQEWQQQLPQVRQ